MPCLLTIIFTKFMFKSGLSGKQLARGKLTVQVLVKTLEGCYIGETRYTYSANLMAQFEQCVKALDDEDMELDFTAGSPDQQHVMLNYKSKFISILCRSFPL